MINHLNHDGDVDSIESDNVRGSETGRSSRTGREDLRESSNSCNMERV